MKDLLEAGVHFGHQTNRWNPKMKPLIYTERKGIHIIDLQKTAAQIKEAYNFIVSVVANGESVLFVGTKKQAQSAVKDEATRCQMPYVNYRWLGGMLTNYETIKKSIDKLYNLEKLLLDEKQIEHYTKKEIIKFEKEKQKMEKVLGGIKEMYQLPKAVFTVDTRTERIAIKEAVKLHIPVIAIVDTNNDPTDIKFPIAGNDDAIRAVSLITSIMANAVMEGRRQATMEHDDDNDTNETQGVEDIKDIETKKSEKESFVEEEYLDNSDLPSKVV